MEKMNEALERCGSKYKAKGGRAWASLMANLVESNIGEMEYIALARAEKGAHMLVEGWLCSKKAWDELMEARDRRIADNLMVFRLNMERLGDIPEDRVGDDVSNPNVEFISLFRYCVLRSIGDQRAREWEDAARWDMATRPEVGRAILSLVPSMAPFLREVDNA